MTFGLRKPYPKGNYVTGFFKDLIMTRQTEGKAEKRTVSRMHGRSLETVSRVLTNLFRLGHIVRNCRLGS